MKTDRIFPVDLDFEAHSKTKIENKTELHYDRQIPHRDHVLRQELFSSYEIAVKSDLKKPIPG